MRFTPAVRFASALICSSAWLLLIVLPLAVLIIQATATRTHLSGVNSAPAIASALIHSVSLSAVIASFAVLLGWLPGRLLATQQQCRTRHRDLLFFALLMPLILPQYVLYYAWSILLSPTTGLGRILAQDSNLARLAATVTSTGVMVTWYWPLAALVLAQGWRGIDRRLWDSALLETNGLGVLRHIAIPLLARPVMLAWAVCFVLSLSEFTTFHLASVRTLGTELAVLYQLTGSNGYLAQASWPVILVALPLAVVLGLSRWSWMPTTPAQQPPKLRRPAISWATLAVLLAASLLAPVAILVISITDLQPFRLFLKLHTDEIAWSLLISFIAALLANLTALAGLPWRAPASRGRLTSDPRSLTTAHCGLRIADCGLRTTHWRIRNPKSEIRNLPLIPALKALVRITIFLVMLLPASLVASSLLEALSSTHALASLRQHWFVVSAGQASRFAGAALILLLLGRYPDHRHLSEMAAVDGASPFQTWLHVHLPRTWPIYVASLMLVTMLGCTELAATMVLLPAGVPNFAQRLLNQMHYARDQQVIASCLILMGVFAALAAAAVVLLRAAKLRRPILLMLLASTVWMLPGCDFRKDASSEGRVLRIVGTTGQGPGEFLYPRAMDVAPDGTLFVVDKTDRIQQFSPDGRWLSTLQMPLTEAGKPTGVTLAPDGRLFVADTHYHRVVIFSPDGRLIDQFGRYGTDAGCFIYPTDVAFAPDGRIFVSEYGGNDRISIYSKDHHILSSFGGPGSAAGQLSRPAALAVDEMRQCLYVADACNHRVAVYDLQGNLQRYFGSAGRGPGELRYPYGLALLPDGTLAVCEFGNNRVQLFDPQGTPLGAYGQAGREPGELAYPWGVAAAGNRRIFVVDAGNNRVQLWQL